MRCKYLFTLLAVAVPGFADVGTQRQDPNAILAPCNIELPAGRAAYVGRTWPQGVVPYVFSDDVTLQQRRRVLRAMFQITRVTPIRFVERNGQQNYIRIEPASANSSTVGMRGGRQRVQIASWGARFVIVHELMHALGFWHEQQRADRDEYVRIEWDRIEPGREHNFEIRSRARVFGGYDFDSVMHYGQCAFSICNNCGTDPSSCRTITVLPPYDGWQSQIGQRRRLSNGDRDALRHVYRPALVVADEGGTVRLLDLLSGIVMRSTQVGFPIARIDLIDIDGDAVQELIVLPLDRSDMSAVCLQLPDLTLRWQSDQPCSVPDVGDDRFRVASGDFDGDGALELLLPLAVSTVPGGPILRIFDAGTGSLEAMLPPGEARGPAFVYRDPDDGHWRLIAVRPAGASAQGVRSYDLTAGIVIEWDYDLPGVSDVGGVAHSLYDGQPYLWVGGPGRTLHVLDRNGQTIWADSFGGTYGARGVYAGELRGSGTEILLIGGGYGENHVRLDAVDLADGQLYWTFDDDQAHGWILPVVVRDTNGNRTGEVYAITAQGGTNPPWYLGITGRRGNLRWRLEAPETVPLPPVARTADIDGNGIEEVLFVTGRAVVAADAGSGLSLRTYHFPQSPTSIETLAIDRRPCAGDLTGDGAVGEDDLALVLAAYGDSAAATPETGDLDGDGDVDLADLSRILSVFGTACD